MSIPLHSSSLAHIPQTNASSGIPSSFRAAAFLSESYLSTAITPFIITSICSEFIPTSSRFCFAASATAIILWVVLLVNIFISLLKGLRVSIALGSYAQ